MANNAEILAQLEKLASAAAAGVKIRFECDDPFGAAFLSALQDSCFPQILAAARRWVKIEEAASKVIGDGMPSVTVVDVCRNYGGTHHRAQLAALDAALKEPS